MPELGGLKTNSRTTDPINQQSACRLYTVPLAIRTKIFEIALTRYEDLTAPFDMNWVRQFSQSRLAMDDEGSPRYRIGHQHRLRTCTALLLTCKRVYDETRLLIISVNEHCLRYVPSDVRGLPEEFDTKADLPLTATKYFSRMTAEQLVAVQKVHIFADRDLLSAMDPGTYMSDTAWAELGFMRCGGGEGYRPRPSELLPRVDWNLRGPFPAEFTITVCYKDWGPRGKVGTGLENMLHNVHWENVLGGVKVFTIELENLENEIELLQYHAGRFLDMDFDIGNGEVLVPDERWEFETWTGDIDFGPPEYPIWRVMDFYLVSVTWRVK